VSSKLLLASCGFTWGMLLGGRIRPTTAYVTLAIWWLGITLYSAIAAYRQRIREEAEIRELLRLYETEGLPKWE
jgi:hypothetical protein